MIFSGKKGSVSFWIFQLSTIAQIIRKKNKEPFLRKTPNCQLDKRTDRQIDQTDSFWIFQLSTIAQIIRKKKRKNLSWGKPPTTVSWTNGRTDRQIDQTNSFWIFQLSTTAQIIRKKNKEPFLRKTPNFQLDKRTDK